MDNDLELLLRAIKSGELTDSRAYRIWFVLDGAIVSGEIFTNDCILSGPYASRPEHTHGNCVMLGSVKVRSGSAVWTSSDVAVDLSAVSAWGFGEPKLTREG